MESAASLLLSAVNQSQVGTAWFLGVVAKRTYTVRGQLCWPVEDAISINLTPKLGADGLQLDAEADIILGRSQVDVIVKGHAYPPRGARQFVASIQAGALNRSLLISGDRKVELGTGGEIRFSPPGAMEKVPLGWINAYGGVDRAALARHGDPLLDMMRQAKLPVDERFGLFAYPRNPLGKGYLIENTAEGVARCQLPNIELRATAITPQNLVRGRFELWPQGPQVASTDWLPLGLFPRSVMSGFPPLPYDEQALTEQDFFEVAQQALPAKSIKSDVHFSERFDERVRQGSAVGMRIVALKPTEAVELVNLHPQETEWRFRLPTESPTVALRGPNGEHFAPRAMIKTLCLEPDANRVVLVWVAEERLNRPLTDDALSKCHHSVIWT